MKQIIYWMKNDRRRVIGLVLLVAGLAVVGLKAWQIATTVRSLQSRITQAQAMAQSANPKIDPAKVEALLIGVRADVLSLRADTGPLLWLAPYLGWLPGIGGDLQAAPALLDMADGLTEAGVLVWQGMSPFIKSWNAPGQVRGPDVTQRALAQLSEAHPQIEQARADLARAARARASIRVERLSAKLGGQVRKLDGLLPLAQMGAEVALALPAALGLDGPRTYLILAQNEDEMRPTGGFISGAGRITFDRGELTALSFMDANLVDDLTRPYPDWPKPLARYMGGGQMTELWLFRDSNWSPDFPTSAKQAAYFYTYGQRVPVDGIVAVDQRAVQMLISAMGPISVVISETQTTVTGDNVLDMMREAWNPPGGSVTQEWMITRKGFMGQFAAAVRARIETAPGSVPWTAVGRTMLQALDERHVLVYVKQPDLAALLAQKGWDGAIRTTNSDYLMTVDANVGYNKVNAAVTQGMNYTVTLASDGSGLAVLTMDYYHSGKPGAPCQQGQPYGPHITYQSMFNGCFYNYLRVYAPNGAQLLDSTRQSLPASYFLSRQTVNSQAEKLEPEAGKSVFALMFVVETGKSWQTHLAYQLPSGLVQRVKGDHEYSLWIQKQPGKSAIPTVVTVILPPGAKAVSIVPSTAAVGDGQVRFEFLMTQDTYIEVRYRD